MFWIVKSCHEQGCCQRAAARQRQSQCAAHLELRRELQLLDDASILARCKLCHCLRFGARHHLRRAAA